MNSWIGRRAVTMPALDAAFSVAPCVHIPRTIINLLDNLPMHPSPQRTFFLDLSTMPPITYILVASSSVSTFGESGDKYTTSCSTLFTRMCELPSPMRCGHEHAPQQPHIWETHRWICRLDDPAAVVPTHEPLVGAEARERLPERVAAVEKAKLEWLRHAFDGAVSELKLLGEAMDLLLAHDGVEAQVDCDALCVVRCDGASHALGLRGGVRLLVDQVLAALL